MIPLNGYGWGNSTSTTTKTNQYISGSVSNLIINSSFPSCPLMITWSPPETRNGEIVQYLVWVQNPNNNNQCVLKLTINCAGCTNNITNFGLPDNNTIACKTISGSTFSSNATTLSLTINDSVIIACSDYIINVRPLNGYGWGDSTNKSIKTNQYILDPVSHLTCTNSSYHSIWCTWSSPIIKNGVILNYRISYFYDSINYAFNVSNTTESINITNNIFPDVPYNIEITPINICGPGKTTNFSITIMSSIDAEVINASQIADLMNSSTLKVKDDRYEISIILPFKHFTDNRGRIIKFTVVVHQIINDNDNFINKIGRIAPPSYSDQTYAYCIGKYPCAYEIDVTNIRNSNRRKRATHSYQDREFTIGNAKTSNEPNDYTNNGQLQPNTRYRIAFRAYTRSDFISVGFLTMSTKIDKVLVIGLTIASILLLAGGILTFIFVRKRIWNNRPPDESIIIPLNQGRAAFGKSPLVIDFYVNFHYMRQESNKRLIIDYQDIDKQSKQLVRKGLLEFAEGSNLKNRYKNIQPYKHNMVKLLETNDYINASKICFEHWGMDIENQCRCTDIYIATQCPISENKEKNVSTVGDFWRMIIENNVCTIVNLNNWNEETNENSCQYWLENINNKARYMSGNEIVEVTMLDLNDYQKYIKRTFKVSMNETEKTVEQFHLKIWEEQSCPEVEDFLQFYKTYEKSKAQSGAIVVHCSAGVGRTGTFIMIDEELSRIKSISDRIEIFNNLIKLRTCRCKMVQNESQYCFIYTVIYEYLVNTGLVKVIERDVPQHSEENPYEFILT